MWDTARKGVYCGLPLRAGGWWSSLFITTMSVTLLLAGKEEVVDVRIPSSLLRLNAVFSPLPIFPPDLIHQRIDDVVVAQEFVEKNGVVRTVDILESPHEATAAAARVALRQWRFKPFTPKEGGRPMTASGRLIFYFRSTPGGHPEVIDAVASVWQTKR